jgi:SAM-dependent methyltransferase
LEIIDLHSWFNSPPGQYLLAWEQARCDEAVADIFGYHSLQLGMPMLAGLRTNRMPHQWLALGQESLGYEAPWMLELAENTDAADTVPFRPTRVHLWTEPEALPFSAASLDLVLLPHTLELSADPHAALREVERVLVPEGRVVICGLNPTSLWGWRQQRTRLYQRLGSKGQLYLPDAGELIAYRRLRDWLRLLNFEVESAQFGCYRPAVAGAQWLQRLEWMDNVGARWWPILGSAYFVVAVKRVPGMRLMDPGWRTRLPRSAVSVPIANRGHRAHRDGMDALGAVSSALSPSEDR